MRALQRYVVYDEIASGGMAAVHLGVLRGGGGFARVVAIKVMHAHFAKDKHFHAMFLDEARIVARVRDPHVVSTLDILEDGGDLFLVMDYVNGPSLAKLLKDVAVKEDAVPLRVAVTIVMDLLDGLHAAHEARSEKGEPLGVVHRDVSPHNVLVGSDGLSRVMDFGIATAADQLHRTEPGEVKGKASYMAPEHALGETLDRRADVYATGIVLYETLTLRRPFAGKSFAELALKHVNEAPARPSLFRSEISPELDAIVLRALAKDPKARWATAREMREALDGLGLRLAPHDLGAWVAGVEPEFFRERDALVTTLSSAAPSKETHGSDENTRAERPVVANEAPPRKRSFALVAIAGIGIIGTVAGVTAMRESATSRPHEPAPPLATTTTPPSASIVATAAVASAPAIPSVVETPKPSATTASTPTTTTPHASVRTTAVVTTRDAAAPLPDCCVGNLRLNVGNCHENCPPGT